MFDPPPSILLSKDRGHGLPFFTSNRCTYIAHLALTPPPLKQEFVHATSHPDYSRQSSPRFPPSASPTPAAPYPKSTHHTATGGSSGSSSGQGQQRRCRTLSESTVARRPTRGGSSIAEEPGNDIRHTIVHEKKITHLAAI